MTVHTVHQRCRNHEWREAVCRCPSCGNSFCRECVSEHEFRLLCASCIHALAQARRSEHAKKRIMPRWIPAIAMTVAGVLLAALIFFSAGETILTIAVRAEQASWQNR